MKKYFKLLCINSIPILTIQLLLMLLWTHTRVNFTFNYVFIPNMQMFLNTLFIPVLLLYLNKRYKAWDGKINFVISLVMMLISSLLGNLISYLSWGISSGRLNNPDSMTIAIVEGEIIVSSVIIIMAGLILFLLQLKKGKNKSL